MELTPPYTMVISGQTGSGKTYFVNNLLQNIETTHDRDFDLIILAFSIMQPIYMKLKAKLGEKLELVEGFPTDKLNEITESTENKNILLILDDMMVELENDKRIAVLFTKMRHRSVSTIFLVQNLYHEGKYMRTVTRNSHYLVIFENPRDASMISTLGRQVFPETPKFLIDAFNQATKKPFGYLLLDFKPGSDKKLRVREGLFPHEQAFVYLPK